MSCRGLGTRFCACIGHVVLLRNGFGLPIALRHLVAPVSGNGYPLRPTFRHCIRSAKSFTSFGSLACERYLSINGLIFTWYSSTIVYSLLHQDQSAGHRRFHIPSHWRCIYSSCRLFFISSSSWAPLLAANCSSYTPVPILDWFCS